MKSRRPAQPSAQTSLIDSPIGPLWLETTSQGIRRLEFMSDALGRPKPRREPSRGVNDETGLASEVERKIGEYFDGSRRLFALPLDLQGSAFQLDVWQAIGKVPFAETLTYSQIAAAIGRPTSYRAVGNACGANPVVIVLPCHRIVGTDRSLHGFGGGLDVKTWLLRHEGSLGGIRDKRAQPQLAGV